MGHLTSRDAYKKLEDRINWFTQGATASETLTKILQVLFTEKEAKWVAKLPIRPFSLKKAAQLWGTSEAKAEKLLDHLCEKGLLVDSYDRGVRKFVLPPPMIGFFEFSLMRTRGDIDQKYLSELFYQYINVEEDFIKELFLGMDTKLGRVFVNEPVLMTEKTNHILDYERATHIIEEADFIGVGTCFCRHKNYHLGIPCRQNAPMETCLTFGNVARSLSEHGGYTRPIDKSEAKEILEMCYGYNLVQMGENVREYPAFMCNCCGCCCEALETVRRFSPMQPIATTNYIPKINHNDCVSCGKCEKVCPILAISMQENDPAAPVSPEEKPITIRGMEPGAASSVGAVSASDAAEASGPRKNPVLGKALNPKNCQATGYSRCSDQKKKTRHRRVHLSGLRCLRQKLSQKGHHPAEKAD